VFSFVCLTNARLYSSSESELSDIRFVGALRGYQQNAHVSNCHVFEMSNGSSDARLLIKSRPNSFNELIPPLTLCGLQESFRRRKAHGVMLGRMGLVLVSQRPLNQL